MIDECEERVEIREAIRQSRRWLDASKQGQLDATCWIPEQRILVRIVPRWTALRFIATTLGALAGHRDRRPRTLIFIGPGFEAFSPGWARILRKMAYRAGLRLQAARYRDHDG